MAKNRNGQYITRRKIGGKRRTVQVTKQPDGREQVKVLRNENALSGRQEQVLVSRDESDEAGSGRFALETGLSKKWLPLKISGGGKVSEETVYAAQKMAEKKQGEKKKPRRLFI